MAKITRHVCDFNPNLATHDAHVSIMIDDENGDRRKEYDSCGKHLGQFLDSSFVHDERTKTVRIRKLIEGELPVKAVKEVTKTTYTKEPCPVEGCERELAPQGLRRHLEVIHPDYVKA